MKKIEEALIRRNEQDIIYIGDIASRLYNGAQGDLLRAIVNGKISENATGMSSDLPADRALGRIEAYHDIIIQIEQAIADAEEMRRPLTQDEIDSQI